MACGEKVVHFTRIEEKTVPADMAEGTTIRWLISGSDGARNFYMRLFSMKPRAHIRPHFHPWEHEIYIVSGSGRVRIGSRTYSVGEGFAIYIPPNVEHEYWSGEEGLRFICVIPARPTAEEREEPVEC